MVWKGRLNFKQYIPSKRHRFGVKLFVLCHCHTGFVLDFIIYTGQQTEVQLNSNWYSNPALFEKLHYSRTGACGTVRCNRVGLSTFPSKLHTKIKCVALCVACVATSTSCRISCVLRWIYIAKNARNTTRGARCDTCDTFYFRVQTNDMQKRVKTLKKFEHF